MLVTRFHSIKAYPVAVEQILVKKSKLFSSFG